MEKSDKNLKTVQIFEETGKVVARSFDGTLRTFKDVQYGNLSKALFPTKSLNLKGRKLYVVYRSSYFYYFDDEHELPITNRNYFLYTVAERFNATLKFSKISRKTDINEKIKNLTRRNKLDFYLSTEQGKSDLESYVKEDWCFLAPEPEPYSITELILFLPMDSSTWFWFGITMVVSTLIWRLSEGHWSFPFGAFAFFTGQAQLVIRIRTLVNQNLKCKSSDYLTFLFRSHLTMKILLQLLIVAIFVISNGYQSIVTSFMLEPIRVPLLKTLNDLLDSDLKIEHSWNLECLHGSNPNYLKAKREGRFINPALEYRFRDAFKENYAFQVQCEKYKNFIARVGEYKIWNRLYLVPEPFDSMAVDLYTKPFHPYLDQLQQIMDQSFEAGLPVVWKSWYFLDILGYSGEKIQQFEKNTEGVKNNSLDFTLIAPFFLILFIGFVAAFIALLFEIFYHDFVSELSKEYFKRKFAKKERNELRTKRKTNVRKIQVKPKKI